MGTFRELRKGPGIVRKGSSVRVYVRPSKKVSLISMKFGVLVEVDD